MRKPNSWANSGYVVDQLPYVLGRTVPLSAIGPVALPNRTNPHERYRVEVGRGKIYQQVL